MYAIKVLLVEDDDHLRTIIAKYLRLEQYEVEEARTGEEAIDFLEYTTFHLAILDIMLPDMEGYQILSYIKTHKDIPTIMLTARSQEDDKLHGFELGADDYITKPFSNKELMARIKIQLRHFMPSQRPMLSFGNITVDKTVRQVFVAGEALPLTVLEYQLLMYFIDNEKLVLSRQQILDEVWGMDYYGDVRTVDTTVKRLRQKLDSMGESIQTIRGVGYKWEVLS